MKKLLIFALTILLSMPLVAQEKLFIVFEMMKVDNEQEAAYSETEQFWKKIHEKRVAAGEIIGWDLWQLLPGGEDQGYQYATATLYNSAEKMFEGSDLMARAKEAYPNMSEDELNKKLIGAAKTRDLAVRIYMERIDGTTGDFKMKVGTVATMDFMKVDMNNYEAYEKAEIQVFKPTHQKMVNAGAKGSWGLVRFMVPYGSDTYASHITVNMFENMKQFLKPYDPGQPTPALQKAMTDGLKTRDMKYSYLARLIEMVN